MSPNFKTRAKEIIALLAVLLAVPFIVAGCGGGDDNDSASKADVEAATAAAQVTVEGLKAQNPRAICRSLSPAFVKQRMKTMPRCVNVFKRLLKNVEKGSTAVDLGEVTLDGDRGEADLFNAQGDQQGKVYLVREDGQWYSTLEAPKEPKQGKDDAAKGKDDAAAETTDAENSDG